MSKHVTPEVFEDAVIKEKVVDTTKAKHRKSRSSSVPVDYDPTPVYNTPPGGYERPLSKCHVESGLASPLANSDLHHLWRLDPTHMGEAQRKHRFLATKVVAVAGDFYVKDKTTGIWSIRRKGHEVLSALMNDWGRDQTNFHIRKETLKSFFAGNEFIVLDGLAYIPGAGDFVSIKGRKYLNTHYEPVQAYQVGAVKDDAFHKLLEMIVFNLLGRETGTPEEWIQQIHAPDHSAIKWLFHWMASQYQRPGKYLPTALWFVGKGQGVGKGLFTSGLANLVGQSNAKRVSGEEFGSDWTDFLMGSALLILDEVDFGSRRAAYDKTKRIVGNPTVSARKRNVGDIEVPTVFNVVFTTNNMMPLALDEGDRRHTFFLTQNTQEAKVRAREFYNLGPSAIAKAWEGMAEFLANIDIDDNLIAHAWDTPVKAQMVDNNKNPVQMWFETDSMLEKWPVGYFASSEWLAGEYLQWAATNAPSGCATRTYFTRIMGDFSNEGVLLKADRKTLPKGKRTRGFVRFAPGEYDGYTSIADVPAVLALTKSAKPQKLYQKRFQ